MTSSSPSNLPPLQTVFSSHERPRPAHLSNPSSLNTTPKSASPAARMKSADPLLSRLTPATITKMSDLDFLPGEKEVGVWAATSAEKIDNWLREVETWEPLTFWSKKNGDGFKVPDDPEQRKKRRKIDLSFAIEETDRPKAASLPVARRLFTDASSKSSGSGIKFDKKTTEAISLSKIDELLSPTTTPLPVKRLDLDFSGGTPTTPSRMYGGGGPLSPFDKSAKRRSLQVTAFGNGAQTLIATPTPLKRQTYDFSPSHRLSNSISETNYRPNSSPKPSTEVNPFLNIQQSIPIPPPSRTPILDSATDSETDGQMSDSEVEDGEEEEFLGSLPTSIANHISKRVTTISAALSQLDIEGLKSRVLHFKSQQIDELGNGRMSDSLAVITATTLQLLPPLHRLWHLLETWGWRVEVCKVVPTFLANLKRVEKIVMEGNDEGAGWAEEVESAVGEESVNEVTLRTLEKGVDEVWEKRRTEVADIVGLCGNIIDGMLDLLEGREETIPDEWIDRLDEVEAAMEKWAFKEGSKAEQLKRGWRGVIRRRREEEERRRRLELERLRREEEDRRRKEEEERIRKAEEERLRKEEEERLRREEEERLRREEEERLRKEEEERLRHEEEARVRKAEEERLRLEKERLRLEEEERLRRAEEERIRQAEEEERLRRDAEEERLRQEAAERLRMEQEEQARKDEEARQQRLAEEEAARRLAEEEEARRKAEELRIRELEERQRKKYEELERLQLAAEEEAARKRAAEEEAVLRKAVEEEAALKKAVEEEAALKKAAEEEEARLRAAEEEEALMRAAEAEQVGHQTSSPILPGTAAPLMTTEESSTEAEAAILLEDPPEPRQHAQESSEQELGEGEVVPKPIVEQAVDPTTGLSAEPTMDEIVEAAIGPVAETLIESIPGRATGMADGAVMREAEIRGDGAVVEILPIISEDREIKAEADEPAEIPELPVVGAPFVLSGPASTESDGAEIRGDSAAIEVLPIISESPEIEAAETVVGGPSAVVEAFNPGPTAIASSDSHKPTGVLAEEAGIEPEQLASEVESLLPNMTSLQPVELTDVSSIQSQIRVPILTPIAEEARSPAVLSEDLEQDVETVEDIPLLTEGDSYESDSELAEPSQKLNDTPQPRSLIAQPGDDHLLNEEPLSGPCSIPEQSDSDDPQNPVASSVGAPVESSGTAKIVTPSPEASPILQPADGVPRGDKAERDMLATGLTEASVSSPPLSAILVQGDTVDHPIEAPKDEFERPSGTGQAVELNEEGGSREFGVPGEEEPSVSPLRVPTKGDDALNNRNLSPLSEAISGELEEPSVSPVDNLPMLVPTVQVEAATPIEGKEEDDLLELPSQKSPVELPESRPISDNETSVQPEPAIKSFSKSDAVVTQAIAADETHDFVRSADTESERNDPAVAPETPKRAASVVVSTTPQVTLVASTPSPKRSHKGSNGVQNSPTLITRSSVPSPKKGSPAETRATTAKLQALPKPEPQPSTDDYVSDVDDDDDAATVSDDEEFRAELRKERLKDEKGPRRDSEISIASDISSLVETPITPDAKRNSISTDKQTRGGATTVDGNDEVVKLQEPVSGKQRRTVDPVATPTSVTPQKTTPYEASKLSSPFLPALGSVPVALPRKIRNDSFDSIASRSNAFDQSFSSVNSLEVAREIASPLSPTGSVIIRRDEGSFGASFSSIFSDDTVPDTERDGDGDGDLDEDAIEEFRPATPSIGSADVSPIKEDYDLSNFRNSVGSEGSNLKFEIAESSPKKAALNHHRKESAQPTTAVPKAPSKQRHSSISSISSSTSGRSSSRASERAVKPPQPPSQPVRHIRHVSSIPTIAPPRRPVQKEVNTPPVQPGSQPHSHSYSYSHSQSQSQIRAKEEKPHLYHRPNSSMSGIPRKPSSSQIATPAPTQTSDKNEVTVLKKRHSLIGTRDVTPKPSAQEFRNVPSRSSMARPSSVASLCGQGSRQSLRGYTSPQPRDVTSPTFESSLRGYGSRQSMRASTPSQAPQHPTSPTYDPNQAIKVVKRKSHLVSKPQVRVPEGKKGQRENGTTSPVSPIDFPGVKPVLDPPSTPMKGKELEDRLERKINKILIGLPSLTMTPSPMKKPPPMINTAVEGPPPKQPKFGESKLPIPRVPSTPTISQAPNLTLVSKRTISQPGEVKMYHLHRSDDESPVKLFVRLVGDKGERVMVRVGGGWADLKEYLMEYAVHHGTQGQRRITSESIVEFGEDARSLRASTSNSSLRSSYRRSPTPTFSSRPNSPLPGGVKLPVPSTSRGNTPGRSESPFLNKRADSPSLASTKSSPGMRLSLQNLQSQQPRASPTTPSYDRPGTPGSAGFHPLYTSPSYGGLSANYRRPTSRLSFGEGMSDRPDLESPSSPVPTIPLGLAGPKSRNVEISAEKQAWVDGMLGQVRKASAERSVRLGLPHVGSVGSLQSGNGEEEAGSASSSGTRLAEMGKVGATRRMYLTKQPSYATLQKGLRSSSSNPGQGRDREKEGEGSRGAGKG
ncbi:hypothetical protein ABW19_dt0203345 [Dactylella cylindrospora]|nr:hypothetical protein ABW19_dt0203345 [Dactylella cylindrospora]